ncbi:hypothetical protein Y032_0014g2209 [Ancylostoma ceylanicum]|uniref:Uncharacterized protein n=1 Tax=Ancylostoma ceylanicum TaxID=53326 RepID=A0A016V8C3_9BILA|nr:hypothetical protein Y032_0014g2209 [Ancylostoma ceylanicum]
MTSVATPYNLSTLIGFICPTSAQKTCLFLPSAARTFKSCSRDVHVNRLFTSQQRTSCQAAPKYCAKIPAFLR